MRKRLLAIFSVSITAGTIYLSYLQVKKFMVNSLVRLWADELKKSAVSLNKTELTKLTDELSRLNILEINLLKTYTLKKVHDAPKNELKEVYTKLQKQKILEKVDLVLVDSILFSTNQ